MSKKLISIIGPTAVGKTAMALQIAQELQGARLYEYDGFDLISADSRQVYSDIPITSGADIPPDFTKEGDVYIKETISLHGVQICGYQDEWSLAHFKEFAEKIITSAWEGNRLPIIVGGTGLYHDHLFKNTKTVTIKPDEELRADLERKDVEELKNILEELDATKLYSMNNSDVNNTVRLIRAIEIARHKKNKNGEKLPDFTYPEYEHMIVGLKDSLIHIEKKIRERVEARFHTGAVTEVEALQIKVQEHGLNKQLLSATGVKEIQAYLDGAIDSAACLEQWTLREFKYAKRQLTWWRKNSLVGWYDVADEQYKRLVIHAVKNFLMPVN